MAPNQTMKLALWRRRIEPRCGTTSRAIPVPKSVNVESTSSSAVVTVSNNSVHAYQKNGITATGAGTGSGSPGPVATIKTNYIVGMAATAMNWAANAGAAERMRAASAMRSFICPSTVGYDALR